MSKINVNQVDTQCGSTLTLGSSGKTVTLASGASQTGFGRTGTVDWCTTAKTSPFTAVSGDGFFVNTTSGGITVTLPASPSAGDIVAFKDYANTWDSNAVTLCRNGSKINGVCSNTNLTTESQSVTLIYVDGTKGWQDIHDSTANITGAPAYVIATGGTETTSPCGNFKIHTFTADGPFNITNAGQPSGSTQISYVVVGGGGGGAGTGTNPSSYSAGGGGAGGFREGKCSSDPYSDSPLDAGAGISATVTDLTITVGGGGSGSGGVQTSPPTCAMNGNNSVFSTITSTGGGAGGYGFAPGPSPGHAGVAGGSGGGGGGVPGTGGAGNTPPVSPPQGNSGGPGTSSNNTNAGGGGGAGAVGGTGCTAGGAGGAGVSSSITGSAVTRAGGGGGGAGYPSGASPGGAGAGGSGGGGAGNGTSPSSGGAAGTANTGGGGGGGGSIYDNCNAKSGGAGGSGIVILRYKFQN